MSSSLIRPHKLLRACLVASLVGLGAAVPMGTAVAATRAFSSARSPHQAVTAAAAGAGWIARDLSPNGALVDAESHKPSPSDTASAILALVASGYGANQVKSATNWLEHNYSSYVSLHGVDNAGALALVILAAVAGGANPTQFGGRKKSDNLVARLEATQQKSGATAGAFGTAPAIDAFFQSLSLLALVAAKAAGKVTRLGEAYLAGLQCPDGGWEYARTAANIACVTPNPKTFTGPDTSSTAIAVMALVATKGHFSHSPLSFFENSQEANGSFGVYGVAGQGQLGDPDSTAYAIQALVALHALGAPQFTKSGVTPEAALARFQFGCKAPASEQGEFIYASQPSQSATLEAVPAAAGVAFPVTPRKLSASEPRLACGA